MLLLAQVTQIVPMPLPPASPNPSAPISERSLLDSRVDQIVGSAKSRTGGTLGVVIWDMGTDIRVERNSDQAFPMATISNLAIAFAVCRLVDDGRLQFDESLGPGTVRQLLDQMITQDDISASDFLYHLLDGPDGINAALHAVGVDGVILRTNESGLIEDANQGRTFAQGGDDAASPASLAQLFSKIANGKVLSTSSAAVLNNLLARSGSPSNRLRAGFPQNVEIEHEAGTSGSVNDIVDATNDVAIVSANGRRMIVVAMLQGAHGDDSVRSAIIADVARAAYDATRLFPLQ